MEITALTALELGKKIKAGEVTVEEAVKAQLEKIKERDSVYNCYVTVMEEEALKRAAEVQKQIDAGELKDSPLAGVPVAIKDNICTKGVLTTCSSKILNNFKPPYDATVIEKLEADLGVDKKEDMEQWMEKTRSRMGDEAFDHLMAMRGRGGQPSGNAHSHGRPCERGTRGCGRNRSGRPLDRHGDQE